jgi:hypothetical protein
MSSCKAVRWRARVTVERRDLPCSRHLPNAPPWWPQGVGESGTLEETAEKGERGHTASRPKRGERILVVLVVASPQNVQSYVGDRRSSVDHKRAVGGNVGGRVNCLEEARWRLDLRGGNDGDGELSQTWRGATESSAVISSCSSDSSVGRCYDSKQLAAAAAVAADVARVIYFAVE